MNKTKQTIVLLKFFLAFPMSPVLQGTQSPLSHRANLPLSPPAGFLLLTTKGLQHLAIRFLTLEFALSSKQTPLNIILLLPSRQSTILIVSTVRLCKGA